MIFSRTVTPLRAVAMSSLVLAYACANLPEVAADTCGNRVVEAAEDCDTFDVGPAKCGARGTATACRLQCATTSDCPTGWGCGTDKICRAPSGRFDTTFTPVASGQVRLQTGDFDGDGRKDLLASSVSDLGRPEIHFMDDSGKIAQTLLVGASIRGPQVTRSLLKDDGLDDVAFASSSGGVDILLGQGDRTVVPAAYPTSFAQTDVAFYGLSGSLANDTLPLTGTTGNRGLAVIVGSASGKPLLAGTDFNEFVPLPIPPMLALAQRGDVVDGAVAKVLPGSACGELLLLIAPLAQGGANGPAANNRGAGELDIIPVCKKDTLGQTVWNDSGVAAVPPIRVPLTKIDALKLTLDSLAVGDLDNDGATDVIINFAPQTNSAHAPFVYNVKATSLTELQYTLKGQVGSAVRPNPILATGDMDGNGLTDVVFSDQIAYGSSKAGSSLQYVTYARNTGEPWAQAILADMNGDSFPDIAASTPQRTLVDFYVGGPGGFVSPGTLPTSGSVARLGLGDYDGDNVTDLGILVRAAANSAGADVMIAYGRRQGLPETPRRVASFTLANDLTTLPSYLDVLTVIGNDPMGPTTAAAALAGDADRFPLAVRSVEDKDHVGIGPALAVFAGALSAKGQSDMGALYGDLAAARTSGVGVAVAPQGQQFQGDLGPFVSTIPPKGGAKAILVGTESLDVKVNRYLANSNVPIAIGDVNGDQIDDVFIVSGTIGGKNATILKLTMAGEQDVAAAPSAFGVTGKLLLVDVDGDAWKDLVYVSGFTSVLPGRAPGEITQIAGTSTMTVFFNDGKGTILGTGVPINNLVVSAAPGSADGGEAGAATCKTFANPTAIANIRANASGKSSLVILTANCLYSATIDRSGAGRGTSLLDKTLSIGFSLAVGDMTGDGVDEIAFLDDRSLSIVKQFPVLP
jgi:hypothetical protein